MKLSLIVLSLIFAFIIAFSSVLWTSKTVTSESDLKNLWFGQPLDFAIQDQSDHYDPPSYPWRTSFTLPQENPTHIAWWPLVMDILFFALIIFALLNAGIKFWGESGEGKSEGDKVV